MTNSKIQEKKMLLEQFYNLSLQIGHLFSILEINEALSLIYRKDNLIKALSQFNDVQHESFAELKEKIKKQELANLELSKKMKSEIEDELKKLNKNIYLKNIYDNQNLSGSIVDITD